ncbi:MAG: bifunctional adenosylcobinamide kinase/adenosylcobinamide-phosphate guanylyltransferase [Thermodesulforhabdaceae bacterium]
MSELHLVLGGAKSGKSFYAEQIITAAHPPYIYIATAEVLDEEMAERVKHHKERRGKDWITYEEPLKLTELLESLLPNQLPILVDCITLWLSNLLIAEKAPKEAVERLCSVLNHPRSAPIVLVSNEVGWGIVPDNALARKFRDVAGWANQKLAAVCTHVSWMIAGIPILIKHPQSGMVFNPHVLNTKSSPHTPKRLD